MPQPPSKSSFAFGYKKTITPNLGPVNGHKPIKVTTVKKQPVGQSTLITKKKTVIPNTSATSGGGRKLY